MQNEEGNKFHNVISELFCMKHPSESVMVTHLSKKTSRWRWFHIFFIFTPTSGDDPI